MSAVSDDQIATVETLDWVIAYMSDPNTRSSALHGLDAPMGASLDAMESLTRMVQGLRDTFVRVHNVPEAAARCTCEPHPVFGHIDACRYVGMGR